MEFACIETIFANDGVAMKVQRITTTAVVVAELSHILCCGLPIFVAVLSAATQVGVGGGFAAFHELIHDHEFELLMGSGALLLFGLIVHYVSHQLNCRTTGCESVHGDCAPKKYRVGWIFMIAVVLYIANLTFYILSGHASHAHF